MRQQQQHHLFSALSRGSPLYLLCLPARFGCWSVARKDKRGHLRPATQYSSRAASINVVCACRQLAGLWPVGISENTPSPLHRQYRSSRAASINAVEVVCACQPALAAGLWPVGISENTPSPLHSTATAGCVVHKPHPACTLIKVSFAEV